MITEPPDPSGFYTHRVPSCSPASGVRRNLCFLWPHPESGPPQREMDLHTDCAPNSFQSHVCPGLERASCAHMAKPNSKGDEKNYHLTGSRTIWRITSMTGFPGDALVKDPPANAGGSGGAFHPWAGKIPWRRAWQPTPGFLPRKFHGQRSLMGYSLWDCKILRHNWACTLHYGNSCYGARSVPEIFVLWPWYRAPH